MAPAPVATGYLFLILLDLGEVEVQPSVPPAASVACVDRVSAATSTASSMPSAWAATDAVAVAGSTTDGTTACRDDSYRRANGVIFTDPALATAGLSEAEARAAGLDVASRVLELENVPRALANRDTRAAIKLVADANTGKVLGVHAVAEGAGLILAGVYAIKFGLTVDDLATTWAPYLTMSESLKLVAQSFVAT